MRVIFRDLCRYSLGIMVIKSRHPTCKPKEVSLVPSSKYNENVYEFKAMSSNSRNMCFGLTGIRNHCVGSVQCGNTRICCVFGEEFQALWHMFRAPSMFFKFDRMRTLDHSFISRELMWIQHVLNLCVAWTYLHAAGPQN